MDMSKQLLYDGRAKAWAEALDIRLRCERENRDLTTDEDATFTRALDEVERLDAQLDRHPDRTTARNGDRLPKPGGTSGGPGGAEFRDGRPLAENRTLVEWAQHRGQVPEHHEDLSLQKYLRGILTGDWTDATAEQRAMGEGTQAGGGYMVPTILSAQIVDLARNKTRVLQAGAQIVPMANKTLDVPKWVGDPSGAWHTEAAVIAPTDGTLGSVRLTAKTLAGLTKASRELLEDAPGVENELRDAFAEQFALTVDKAALYGSGVDPEPRGVKNTSGITVTPFSGANGGTPTNYNFLVDAVGALEDVNEEPNAAIMAPRTERTVAKLIDTTNQPLVAPSMLQNLTRYRTNQIPLNLTVGTSTNTSDVFTADWSKLFVGLRTQLQIKVLTERYADTGELGFLSWWRGDVAVARSAAFHVTTGVRP